MLNNKTTMKKYTIIILLFLLIISVFLFFRNKDEKINEDLSVKQEENTSLIIDKSYEVMSINVNDDYSTFEVKYPYFKYSGEEFNNKIKLLLDEQIESQKINAKDGWQARYDTQENGDNIPKTPAKNDKWQFQSDFTILQSNMNYISFVLRYSGFTGGAHGFENIVSFNYDIKNKKVLSLREVLSNKSNYLEYISDKARLYLKKNFATLTEEDKKNSSEEAIKEYIKNTEDMINLGTEPKEENFGVFTFTPDKVKIYFSQYQVGPYSIGMPEVEIDRK